ncbi:MAG: methyltransferase domain-containing protein, partial [Verrucomicrobiota bacterium]
CGGCQYQHLDYEEQLRWKKQQVAELLERMAGITFPVDDVHASPVQYGYRSKITPHFQKPKDKVMGPIGFLRHGRRQQILDVKHCPIASETINEKLTSVRAEATSKAQFYKKGATLLLRDSTEGYVCTDHTESCEQEVGDLTFAFHAGEFFQNNPHILPDFAKYAADEAAQDGVEHLVDCYCGSGLFCLTSAHRFKESVGIEISESSIDWARRNADSNGIENTTFIQGDATAIFEHVRFAPEKAAVVIDPPRKGSNPEFLNQLIEYGPKRIVYISCNPATQVRDLEVLVPAYQISRIKPFDLFPHTRHLECVVTLVKG